MCDQDVGFVPQKLYMTLEGLQGTCKMLATMSAWEVLHPSNIYRPCLTCS